jgi:hypothetical protein
MGSSGQKNAPGTGVTIAPGHGAIDDATPARRAAGVDRRGEPPVPDDPRGARRAGSRRQRARARPDAQ